MTDLKQAIDILNTLPRYESEGRERVYNKGIMKFGRQIGKDQQLAEKLWGRSDIPGAQNLALDIAEPHKMSDKDLERWLPMIATWDACDGFCSYIARETPYAEIKIYEWADYEPLYERRAGFALAAQMAWVKRPYPDKLFIDFLPYLVKYAADDRYYVKKAVNWALRDIGKRNPKLQKQALKIAKTLQAEDNKTAKWVGKHRINEVIDKVY